MKRLMILMGLVNIPLFAMQETSQIRMIPSTSLPVQKSAENLFWNAIHEGNSTRVEQLLKESTHPEALANSSHNQKPALFEAVEHNRPDIVKILIKNGANPDTLENYLSPLMLAASQGHKDMVFWLLKLGANPNLKDASGQSTLNWVEFGVSPESTKAEIRKMLIDAGAR